MSITQMELKLVQALNSGLVDKEKHFLGIMEDIVEKSRLTKIIDNGFLEAPASTHWHEAYAGGLYIHSLLVAKSLVHLTGALNLKWQDGSNPVLIGMFHDLCKYDAYIPYHDGFVHNDAISPAEGHGLRSCDLIENMFGIGTTPEEKACIRWHMGAYEVESWDAYDKAIRQFPNVLWTHTADMEACKILTYEMPEELR